MACWNIRATVAEVFHSLLDELSRGSNNLDIMRLSIFSSFSRVCATMCSSN
jgi:hypothetical protein